MVRNYKRKTEKRPEGDMIRALRAIEIGTSVRTAARDFSVPEASLRRQWNRNRSLTTATTTTTSTTVSTASNETSGSMEPAVTTRAPKDFIVHSAGHPTVTIFELKMKVELFN